MAQFSPSDRLNIKLEAMRHTQNILAKQEAPTVDTLLIEAKKVEAYLLEAEAADKITLPTHPKN